MGILRRATAVSVIVVMVTKERSLFPRMSDKILSLLYLLALLSGFNLSCSDNYAVH